MKRPLYLLACVGAYLVFGLLVTALFTHAPFWTLFFVWNVFLAFMPFLFAELLEHYVVKPQRKLAVVILLAFLWLIFFPNAPYKITDLIHVGGWGYTGNSGSIADWVILIYVASGAVFAMLMGLSALDTIHALLRTRFGRARGNIALAAILLASGVAIYVGRILRFNSWDVLRPFSLLQRIREDFGAFSALFSLLFSAFIFGTYVIYYVLVRTGGRRCPGNRQ
jgi:uncharacterized membrane protein